MLTRLTETIWWFYTKRTPRAPATALIKSFLPLDYENFEVERSRFA